MGAAFNEIEKGGNRMSQSHDGKETPCNGCTICCKCDAVGLYPQEEAMFQHEPHAYAAGEKMVAHRENGDCVYLGENGCTIHGNKPIKCQTMDCRAIYKNISPREALFHGLAKIRMRGKELCGK
jgi:hypothetical protein